MRYEEHNPALMYNFVDCQLDRGYDAPAIYDPRDDKYLMRDVASMAFVYTSDFGQVQGKIKPHKILDQGVTNHAAAYAWRHWLSASPNASSLGPDVVSLFEYSQRFKPTDVHAPTTIRACARALQHMGHLEAYLWAKSAGDVMNWLRADLGPVVMTAPWYDDMDDPTTLIAHVSGELKAWHSFIILSYVPSRKAFVIVNSHGLYWGLDGKKHIPFDELQYLFNNGAIACSGTGKKVGLAARMAVQERRSREIAVDL